MSLKVVVDSDQYEALDEGTKSLYKQGEGDSSDKYVLEVEGIDDHPHVVGLRNGHKRSKQERQEAKDQLNKLKKQFQPIIDHLGEDEDEIDLSNVDEEQVEVVAKILRGEEVQLGTGDQSTKDKDGKPVDIDKIKATARKPLERELETAKTELEKSKNQLHSVVIDSALSDAISGASIHGPYTKAVKAMFKSMVKVTEDEDGNPTAVIEGEYGEQPVDKHLKEWAQTDEGKEFVAASGSSGGGANGGQQPSGKVKNPWSEESWNMSQQGQIYKEDPEKAKRMAAEHGHTVT